MQISITRKTLKMALCSRSTLCMAVIGKVQWVFILP